MALRSMPARSALPPENEAAIDPAVVRQAAGWMARLWSEDATDEDRAACARWRAEHPDHELTWSRLQGFEDRLCSVPGEVSRQVLRDAGRRPMSRRALCAAGLGAALGGAAYGVRRTDAWQIAAADQSAAVGTIRHIALPDGTRVALASASAIDVRFDRAERLVVLRAGRIMVDTASDPAPAYRPFRVQSREGIVQALGTRFSVGQEAGVSRVAVFEGEVEVRPALGGGAARIHAGQGAAFQADRVLPAGPVQQADASWTRGVLVVDDMPLGDFIAELARYRHGLLRCDPAVADLKVTGAFPLGNTDRALHNLSLGLPVRAVYRTRYWVTVRPV